MTTVMLREIREIPALVAGMLAEDAALYAALGQNLRDRPPSFLATVARGSSDHAATYAAAAIGMVTGRVVATLSPSLITRYGAPLQVADAVVIGLSQSGASPDLVQTLAASRLAGARTVSVINMQASRLAAVSDFVLPQRAGAEQSVAATKSFVLTLVAIARLVAAWAEDPLLTRALQSLPARLSAALSCDWSAAIAPLARARGLFVVGRGPGLGIAQEAALKLKETSNLQAEAFSAAEVQHGPKALVQPGFPILAFGLADAGGEDVRALAASLEAEGVAVLLAGGRSLPLPAPLHPLLDPIIAIAAFYPLAEALAQKRGLNPDHPRGLRKVTETV